MPKILSQDRGNKKINNEELKDVSNRLKELGWQPVCSSAELKQIELKKELPKPVVDKFNIATKAINKAVQEATDIFVRLGNEVPDCKGATPRLHIKAQIRVLNGVADDFKSILTFGENLAGEKLDFEGQCRTLKKAADEMEKLFEVQLNGVELLQAKSTV